jgi:hypothetical protein
MNVNASTESSDGGLRYCRPRPPAADKGIAEFTRCAGDRSPWMRPRKTGGGASPLHPSRGKTHNAGGREYPVSRLVKLVRTNFCWQAARYDPACIRARDMPGEYP